MGWNVAKDTENELPSLRQAFAELRRICEEEGYELEIPTRSKRPNSFLEALHELSAD